MKIILLSISVICVLVLFISLIRTCFIQDKIIENNEAIIENNEKIIANLKRMIELQEIIQSKEDDSSLLE